MINPPLSILLVDDDYGDAKAMVRSIRKSEHAVKVVRAPDGIEALKIMEGLHTESTIEMPYLAFIDINMPKMGGIELLQEIRSRPHIANTIAFILTTSDRPEDLQEAYAHNIAGYLVKGSELKFYEKVTQLIKLYSEIIKFPKT